MGAIREYLREDIDDYLKLGPDGYLQASRDEGADPGITHPFIELLLTFSKLELERLLSGELDKV